VEAFEPDRMPCCPNSSAASAWVLLQVQRNAWLDAFTKQLTPKLIDQLRSFARMRILAVGYAGRKVDDYYARELVQDAIGDTFAGAHRWNPARAPLELHLVRAIQKRAQADRQHAEDHPHDVMGDDTETSRLAEDEASSLNESAELAVKRVYAKETVAQIRAAAADDKPVLRIIDAYDAGARTKEEVITFTKMKPRTYHNAHIRMTRVVRNLCNDKLASKVRA
jgi:hypothetical protein